MLQKTIGILTSRLGQKYKYLKNEKNFYHEIKSIFHHF